MIWKNDCVYFSFSSFFVGGEKLGDAMFVELPRVRLDGGARAFRQHWGYETRPALPPPPLIEEDEAAVEPETVSLREANTASPIGEYSSHFCRYHRERKEKERKEQKKKNK